jgi:hypothetical protein
MWFRYLDWCCAAFFSFWWCVHLWTLSTERGPHGPHTLETRFAMTGLRLLFSQILLGSLLSSPLLCRLGSALFQAGHPMKSCVLLSLAMILERMEETAALRQLLNPLEFGLLLLCWQCGSRTPSEVFSQTWASTALAQKLSLSVMLSLWGLPWWCQALAEKGLFRWLGIVHTSGAAEKMESGQAWWSQAYRWTAGTWAGDQDIALSPVTLISPVMEVVTEAWVTPVAVIVRGVTAISTAMVMSMTTLLQMIMQRVSVGGAVDLMQLLMYSFVGQPLSELSQVFWWIQDVGLGSF